MVKLSLIFLAFSAILPAQMPTMGTGAAPASALPQVDPNTVVITIGEHKITAGQYLDLVKALPAQYQEAARGPGRREFAKNLVELQVLADQAEKSGLDKQPETARQLEFQRENMLAQAEFMNLQQTATVSDADLQAFYDAHKNEYEILTARHILIRVKGAPMPAAAGKPELSDEEALAKAQALRKRIVGGEDFATVAKAESDDTSSGEKGGDLGEFKKGMMVPPFETAAFAQKVGEVGEPVKSPFGYHIIQVQSHTTKSLADVKPELLAQLKPTAARKQVETMAASVKVDISDSYFGPAPAAPAMPPAAPAGPPAAK
jgi:peptidyl-prolyl cis-trans isomerase C